MDPAGSTVVAGLALLGLIQRERFGHSCHLKTSHFTMGVAMQMNRAAETLLAGQPTELLGSASSASAPNQCFQMLDQEFIAVSCDTQAQWEGLCRAIRQETLIGDPRFATNIDRVANRDELANIVADAIKEKPKRWWVLQFEKEQVPHGLRLDYEQIRFHQQYLENNYLTTIDAPHQGPIAVGGVPWEFSKTPARIDSQVAVPAEHTDEVVKDGFGDNVSRKNLEHANDEPGAPLRGLKVIDATSGYAGPFLGLLLAEAGADVIKIESPDGDWARKLAPQTSTGNSALFEAFNRNKESVVLDLDAKSGQQALRALTKDAAVFLEDWGPGVAEKRGLGYDVLEEDNSSLVYLALSAFGERGPMRDLPASELTIQAMTGYLRLVGVQDEPPIRVGADIVATCTGSVAFVGVLAALFHREKTGEGQRVATSQLGAMMSLRSNQWAALTDPDEWLGDSYCTNETDRQHRGYQTRDLSIYMSPSPHLSHEDFLSLLDDLDMREEMLEDAEFAEKWWFTFGMGYLARRAKPIWEDATSKLTSIEVLEIVERYPNVWAVEFSELDALMDHPQVEANGLVESIDSKRYVRAPWRVPWEMPPLRVAR